MGLPVSLILIAVGAVLAFAVNQGSDAQVNVHVLLLALAWCERWGPGYWGWHRSAYDAGPAGGTYRRGYGRRRVVEEDVAGPPPGPDPYDAPPPP